MTSSSSRNAPRSALVLFASLFAASAFACGTNGEEDDAIETPENAGKVVQPLTVESIPNNFPILNAAGFAATYSTAGSVSLTSAFSTPQGSNGRDCQDCHLPTNGWSISPLTVELFFWTTEGTHPIFNPLDANSATADVSTPEARYASYSMLRKGLFRRGVNLSGTAEYEIIAVDDPLHAGGSPTRFEFFRRSMPTANFQHAKNVGWHAQNTNGVTTDVHTGLVTQARGNVTGAQQGQPASDATINEIVTFEEQLSLAQTFTWGAGSLEACGAKGGPQNVAGQALVDGRFNLFDAWINLTPGSCGTKKADRERAKIARGQELFNSKLRPNGGAPCRGCHNAENAGSNVAGTLFNIGASNAQFRQEGMPLYTLRNKTTLEVIQTTDPGRGGQTGRWADLNRFKIPSLRGAGARPSFFHNGIAKNMTEVVHFYEQSLGFEYTPEEEADLVAFLEAL